MKKTLFLCLVLIATKGFGQSFMSGIAKKLEFGLKAGVNVSNFTNASFPTDPLIGFHGGATAAFKITNNFLVQEDFLFSMQGAKIKGGSLSVQDLKLYYVSIPILLKYRTNSGFFAEAGAQAGMKIKEEVAGESNTDSFKKVDVAAVGGIGYQSEIGLGIGARYVYGLSKVGDFKTTGFNNDFKNNNIQASIFYVF